eukprot:9020803-Pyramimonas_sp.AAC.1
MLARLARKFGARVLAPGLPASTSGQAAAYIHARQTQHGGGEPFLSSRAWAGGRQKEHIEDEWAQAERVPASQRL